MAWFVAVPSSNPDCPPPSGLIADRPDEPNRESVLNGLRLVDCNLPTFPLLQRGDDWVISPYAYRNIAAWIKPSNDSADPSYVFLPSVNAEIDTLRIKIDKNLFELKRDFERGHSASIWKAVLVAQPASTDVIYRDVKRGNQGRIIGWFNPAIEQIDTDGVEALLSSEEVQRTLAAESKDFRQLGQDHLGLTRGHWRLAQLLHPDSLLTVLPDRTICSEHFELLCRFLPKEAADQTTLAEALVGNGKMSHRSIRAATIVAFSSAVRVGWQRMDGGSMRPKAHWYAKASSSKLKAILARLGWPSSDDPSLSALLDTSWSAAEHLRLEERCRADTEPRFADRDDRNRVWDRFLWMFPLLISIPDVNDKGRSQPNFNLGNAHRAPRLLRTAFGKAANANATVRIVLDRNWGDTLVCYLCSERHDHFHYIPNQFHLDKSALDADRLHEVPAPIYWRSRNYG